MGLRSFFKGASLKEQMALTQVPVETRADSIGRDDILTALRVNELVGLDGPLNTRPIRTPSQQLDSYLGWVYAAVQILSGDVSARPYSVFNTTGASKREWEEVELHPALIRPNEHQTWEDFAELTSVHLDLAGRAYWHFISSTPGGQVQGMETIVPSWVVGFDIENGRLVRWRIQVPGKQLTKIDAEDIVFMRWPHPTNPLDGASPIQAFALSYNIDLYARAYTGELLQNRAQPQGIISSEQTVTQEQADMLSERWLDRYGEGETKNGPAVLGQGAAYQAISLSVRDLAFLELAQLSRDQMLAIYRVPASKLGLVEDANLANSREAANTYAENALVPRLNKQQRAINTRVLTRLYDDATNLKFEYESPIRRDVNAEVTRSHQGLVSGTVRVNEHRETLGLEPDPNGNVYYIPLGVRIVEDIEPREPFAPAPVPLPDDDGDEPDDTDKSIAAAMAKFGKFVNSIEAGVVTKLSDQDFELSGLRFKAVQAAVESKMKAALRRLFSNQAKLIISKLKGSNSVDLEVAVIAYMKEFRERALTWTDPNSEEFLALPPIKFGIVDDAISETAAEWNKVLSQLTLDSFENGFELLSNEVASAHLLDFELFQASAATWANSQAGHAIVGIQATTQKEVGALIANAVEEGDSIAKISKAISDKFDTYKGFRAETIARTETSNATNFGKHFHVSESERQLGISYLKTWNPVEGDRTREHHRAQNISPAQTIPFAEDFIVNGEAMARPLDDRGSADNVINCRCTTTVEVIE
jgi:HK97 family phage portal protein